MQALHAFLQKQSLKKKRIYNCVRLCHINKSGKTLPLLAFLSADGKPSIEHEVREVKKVEKHKSDGMNVIKRYPGDIKRTLPQPFSRRI
jgi:hypothetical protein